MADIIPVILSGGAGTRLWPLSRELQPKQLLKLMSDRTLLQETAGRMPGAPIIVCNHEHRFIVAEQMRELNIEPRAVVVEPMGRNTAPAVAVSALLLAEDPDALMLVMPSDHRILDGEGFTRAVAAAESLAREGRLVTFGVVPSEPNTGYGYIRKGAATGAGFEVESFVEKPDLATAQSYVESGEYFWNSGIFLFPVRLFLDEMQEMRPDMLELCRKALDEGASDLFFFRLDAEMFRAIRGESVDYAIMEHTRRAAMVPVDIGWSDIGSWSALWQESAKDADGNVMQGDVIAIDSRDCYVRSEKQLVATLGVTDLVVVATGDAVLIADKRHDQQVKAVVEQLKAAGRTEGTQALRVYRPWGWFQTVDDGERFRVKHIQVNPGAKLSLQKHWHRSEHWVVVTGSANVTCGDKTFLLRENESTFIPVGTIHRLENPGRIPLRLIEIQVGAYVGEDDIVRVEDVYGRIEA